MKAKELYHTLKGPYVIIGKSGEYYEVDDISDIALTFGGNFHHFFTFNMQHFIHSKPEKPEIISNYGFNDCNLFLKRLAYDFLNEDKYTSKQLNTIKSISTDLLTKTHFVKIKDPDNKDVKKYYLSEQYFLIKHKYDYNEISSIEDKILHSLLLKVVRNNKRGFNFLYNRLILNKRAFLFNNGAKKRHYRVFRAIGTMPERRLNIAHINEHGDTMVRGARRKLPNSWDDIPRTYQRSWKNKKVSKQWMKNLKTHQDTGIIEDNFIEGESDVLFIHNTRRMFSHS